MKRCYILFIIIGLCFAGADMSTQALPFDSPTWTKNPTQQMPESFPGRTVISPVGDVRTVMGPQGKNIAVSSDGMTIGVVYGPPSDPYDANNAFGGVWVAYSLDQGATWNPYGPHSLLSPLRRIYCGIDGGVSFHNTPGAAYFVWQEGQYGPPAYDPTLDYTMIEENVPSSPSFSSPVEMAPDAMDIDGWMSSIACAPDNEMNVIVTTWSYLANGNSVNYCWVSDDGGYTWSDTIRMTGVISAACYNGAGHVRYGTGDYVFYTYHDEYGGAAQYPHYVESTDGGLTWSVPAQLPAISQVQFWWHEIDCEVINDMPFAAHNDIGTTGTPLFQAFYPDPDTPGSPGAWNWQALNVSGIFDGAHAYQGTTYTCTHIQYPSVCYGTVSSIPEDIEVILIAFKAGYEIAPAPAGWTDGNYLGGILSIDGGRNWYPTRPMSGPLLQAVGGATEAAHDLVTLYYEGSDTTYIYTTWTDADDGVIGNQYFELGVVWAIEDTIFGPRDHGIEEYNDDIANDTRLSILPSVSRGECSIAFSISSPGQVNIRAYDATGRLVDTAFHGYLGIGQHMIDLNTAHFANGVYLIAVESAKGIEVGKLILHR